MPLYYLHLHNVHVDASDDEGCELPDLDAARARAVAGIRDFMGHEAIGGKLDFRGRVDIADADSVIVATIPFVDAFTIQGLDGVAARGDK